MDLPTRMGGPPCGDVAFPAESLVFSSGDFDAIRHGVSRIFKPHRLCLHGSSADLRARMHHLRQGGASVNRLEYGADVEIDPNRLDDFFLIQIPVAGAAQINCGNRHFVSSLQAASLVSPTLPLHMRWHAGNAQICVRFERDMVEQHCAAHLGHQLDRPLEFEPELRLDTPAGHYFIRLVHLFLDELILARGLGSGVHPLAHARVAEHLSAALLNALLYGQKSNFSEALIKPAAVPAPGFVRRAEDHIRDHYAEPITIETLAVVAGVSVRTLFAGFHDFRGTTPMNYLKKVRLESARVALQNGQARGQSGVTQVALECGFSHLGRFAADYRAHFGELPSATAKRHQTGVYDAP
jgi:AraC-like DNA-binding protein